MEDLIAVISLYRPGPMESIPRYIRNRHDPSHISYKHEKLASILDVTYGCIVYQEQVMQICRELAGFSYGRADLVRRAMSKKKAKVMQQEREHFIYGMKREDGTVECPGCIANGVPESIANEIFDEMSSFASYAFNKSHAAAYAYVAYQTAYLKCHYPKEYMAALLTSILDNTDKVVTYINECSRMGIGMLPPDVSRSRESFTVDGDKIRFGLLAIKNIGRSVVSSLLDIRDREPFEDFGDFCTKMYDTEARKRTFECFIKAGALDCFGYTRNAMLTSIDTVLDDIDRNIKKNVTGQLNFFDDLSTGGSQGFVIKNIPEFDTTQLLNMEKEYLGVYVSGHPLLPHADKMRSIGAVEIADIHAAAEEPTGQIHDDAPVCVSGLIAARRNVVTKRGDTMAYLTIEDLTGSLEVIVFPKAMMQISGFRPDEPIAFYGRLSLREEETRLRLERAVSLEEAAMTLSAKEEQPKSSPAKQNKGGKPGILYLKAPSEISLEWAQAKRLLGIFDEGPALVPVWVKFEDENRWEKGMIFADPNSVLLRELRTTLGDQSVVYRDS